MVSTKFYQPIIKVKNETLSLIFSSPIMQMVLTHCIMHSYIPLAILSQKVMY